MSPYRPVAVFVLFAFFFAAHDPAAAADSIRDRARSIPNRALYRGALAKYQMNNLVVHTYESREARRDWSVVFESETGLVLLGPQNMPFSAKELNRYLGSLGKPLAGVIAGYHGVGPDSFPGTPIYATRAMTEFVKSGLMEEHYRELKKEFPNVDPKVILPTKILEAGRLTIGGIGFEIIPHDDGRPMPGAEVAIPEHKMYYMHLLGRNAHSPVASLEEAKKGAEHLARLKDAGYEIFFSSHHMPESAEDVGRKIDYLRTLVDVAELAATPEEFVSEMVRLAPHLKREDYLRETAENLYR